MYSKEHLLYLKKIKSKKRFILLSQLFIFILFIGIWQILANRHLINTFIFSSPKLVLDCLINLYLKNHLLHHIWVTVYETFISFSLATLLGIFIASILWWNKMLAKIMEPYLTILNGLPKVALGPIIIIWFGAGINSIIVMALLISLIITIINIYHGFSNIDKNKEKLMISLRAKKKQMFFYLILPSNIKTIISCLKINISMSLIGVIMGEFLVSKQGIGYLILYGSQVFNLSLVITGILVLCLTATIMYCVISYIEKKLVNNN